MNWLDALQVSTLVVGSLGGGGAIVFGLSRILGDKWLQDWKGQIDAKLQRLDAALQHRNFLLQRLAEFELEALTECWRASRACLPLINGTRPIDSGTDLAVLEVNGNRLIEAHNKLIDTVGRHELLLSQPIVSTLNEISTVLRLEGSHLRYHKPFEGNWWDDGEKNRATFHRLNNSLLELMKARVVELRAKAEED